jgi:hypothetical protein
MELKNMKHEKIERVEVLVRMDSKGGSWFINTNHKQFFNYYILSGFAIIPQNCDCRDEAVNIITT